RDKVGYDFCIGIRRKFHTLLFELAAQFGEILDNAVVHDRDFFSGVGMCVVLGRAAVRRPACVADADRAVERLTREPVLEILQLALCAAPREPNAFERGNARGIIAAIFEALERIDKLRCRRLAADDADNSAHARCQLSVLAISNRYQISGIGYQERRWQIEYYLILIRPRA